MRRYRVSVAGLMCAILVFALGFAALHGGTVEWSQAISALVAMTLAGATSGALFTHGGTRAFCGGLAVFGWQFLAVQSYPTFHGFYTYHTPAYSLAGDIAIAFHPYHESVTQPTQDGAVFDSERKVWLFDADHKYARAEEIALGLLNLIYAVLGGFFALGLVRFSSSRSPRNETTVPPESSRTSALPGQRSHQGPRDDIVLAQTGAMPCDG